MLSYSQNQSYRQHQSPVKKYNIDTVFNIEGTDQHIVHLKKDGTLTSKKIDPFEIVKIIVEFKEEPLFLQSSAKPHGVDFYQTRFFLFASDIRSLLSASTVVRKNSIAQPKIKHNFYKTFFGTALEVPKIALNDIYTLPYVKKIHNDKMMKAYISDALHIVHADSVWSNLGVQGDSIVVGIIDTGIDYKHPALGGQLGQNYKVIGGYDSYNNDNDPFDDNGHGTHVAGIVAANNEMIKGIAPKAKLMAFKVLNADGYGSESTVLDGIERAADPNNDNIPNDKVDIANMSLGGGGTPDDAISTAVNNAVTLGIIFCVAAGNDISFKSIGSPAAAENAITVGATEKNDKIAFFSSKGPTRKTFAMKPDILAPGVDILSTLPGSTYEEKSGTSMASPVVAGICALLKSINRNLTPAMAKSALMSTAVSIDQEAMVQGTGRVDAFAAAKRTAFSTPAQLSYGLDSSQLKIWTRVDTIWITNNAQQSQTFSFSTQTLPNGISILSNTQHVTIPAKGSQSVAITLSVDNSVVPYPENASMTYGGMMYFNGTSDSLKLPWTFVKAAIVLFSFNGSISNFIISSDSYSDGDVMVDENNPGSHYAVVPKGVYDILVGYNMLNSRKIVIKEHVSIGNVTTLSFSPSEAIHRVTTNFVDPFGNNMETSNKCMNICFPDSSVFRSSSYFGNVLMDSTFFSTISDRFSITYSEAYANNDNNVLYLPHGAFNGISSNAIVSNTPSDYRLINIQAELPSDASHHHMTAKIVSLSLIRLSDLYYGFGRSTPAKEFNSSTAWTAKLYLMNSDADNPSAALFEIQRDGTPPYYLNSDRWISSPFIRVMNDSIVCSDRYVLPFHLPIYSNGEIIRFMQTPVYTNGFTINNYFSGSNIFVAPYFYGNTNEARSFNHSFLKIFNVNNIAIFNDSLINSKPLKVAPGKYQSVVSFTDYAVGNSPGIATLTNSFDLQKEDANPPLITSFKLSEVTNRPVAGFSKNDSGWLRISSVDIMTAHSAINIPYIIFSSIQKDSTHLLYKQNGTPTWKELPIIETFHSIAGSTPIGTEYLANLSETTVKDSTAIDLLARFVDQSGNVSEWILSPAYAIGNYKAQLDVREDAHYGASPEKFALYQNFPNPFNPETKIAYDVPKQGQVSIKIFDILGRSVTTLVEQEQSQGSYSILWNGKANDGSTVSSGMYFYRIETSGFVQTRKMVFAK